MIHEEHHHHHEEACEHCHGHHEEEHHGHEHHEGHHGHGEHHHHHEEGGTKESIIKIAVATVLLIAAIIIEKKTDWPTWAYLLVYLIPYLIVGWETLKEAAEAIVHGEALDENFLMSVATLGALGIGFLPEAETQFPEAVFVMLFFQVGELFEGIAEGRSRKSIAHLMDIRPDSAHVERDGTVVTVAPETVAPGEVIVVRPGEKVPMDGVVLEGRSSLDTVALTGESVPRSIGPDDEILSGCVNLSGVLRVRTTKAFGESTAAKILDLVENAAEHKSKSESFITKFARVYTPIVVGLAVLLALVPSMITGEWATWIYRALMFLVVSCPCALVISVPLTFFGGIGGASRKGILVKGANFMDTLSRVRTVVFDKTGTLTEGVFEVTAVHPELIDEKELLHLAAHVERHSAHPIAAALRLAYPNEQDDCVIADVIETAGHGVIATVNGRRVAVGNEKLMALEGAASHPCELKGTIVHVSIDGEYAGHIVISDRVKADAAEAVAALHRAGIRRTVMLTGDQPEIAAAVAAAVGVDSFHAGLLPADKVACIEALLGERTTEPEKWPIGVGHDETRHSGLDVPQHPRLDVPQHSGIDISRQPGLDTPQHSGHDTPRHSRLDRESPAGPVAFVGDGINDAPVLARADLGIAMGALGSDAAIEAADVVLMDDKPSKVAEAVRIARRTLRIARENMVFAIGIKVLVLGLAAVGAATLWMAVFADVGVTVLAVLNAMRALKV